MTDLVGKMVKPVGSDLRDTRDRALILIGFAGAMRRSELVALDVDNITETAEGLRVQVRRSKPTRPAFRRRSRYGQVTAHRLSADYVLRIVKEHAGAAGLSPELFGDERWRWRDERMVHELGERDPPGGGQGVVTWDYRNEWFVVEVFFIDLSLVERCPSGRRVRHPAGSIVAVEAMKGIDASPSVRVRHHGISGRGGGAAHHGPTPWTTTKSMHGYIQEGELFVDNSSAKLGL